MNGEPSYTSVVVTNGDEEDDVEEFEDESEERHEQRLKSTGEPSEGERTCAFISLLSLTFIFGVLVGQLVPTTSLSADSPNNSPAVGNSSNYEQPAVSYNFLSTTRGANVLDGLKQTLDDGGPKKFLQTLEQMMDDDDQVAGSCHPLAHQIGRKALMDLGFVGAFGGMIGTPDDNLFRTCNAAYMHGIIEHYLMDADDLDEGVKYVEENICQNLTQEPSMMAVNNKWECEHGIGHGVVQHIRAKNDRATLVDALAMCNSTAAGTSNCQNGIWMDHFASTRLTTQLEPEYLHICSEANPSGRGSSSTCEVYAGTEYILHYPRDYAGAIKFCEVGLPKQPSFCINGIGAQAVKENIHDFTIGEAACLTAKTSIDRRSCFSFGMAYYNTATGEHKIPAAMCQNLTVYKSMCMSRT